MILLVGPFRGIFMDRLSTLMDVDSGLSIINRIFVSTASTAFWLFLLSYFININNLYRQQYRSLISQAFVSTTKDPTRGDLRQTLDKVQASLRTIQIESRDGSNKSEVLRDISVALKKQVDEIIRPLSRRLWLSAIDEYPRIRLRNTIIDALKNLEYSRILLSSLIAFITFSMFPTFMTFDEAFVRTIIIVVSLNMIGLFFQRLHRRFMRNRVLVSAGEFLVLTFLPISIGDVMYSRSYFQVSTPISLFVYLIIPFVVTSLAMVELIRSDRSRLLSLMATNFREFNSNNSQSRLLASYLHNSLQSELLALAERLERASKDPGDSSASLVLEDLQSLINRSVHEDFLNSYGDSRERLRQVIRNWSGIVDIEIEDVDLIFHQDQEAVTVVQMIEELASNLSKYGNEERLKIVCIRNEDRLFIQLGHLNMPMNGRNYGLGTLLLGRLKYEVTHQDNFLDPHRITYLIK